MRAVAERGKSSMRASSPKASPGPSVFRMYGPCGVARVISTPPSTTTNSARPGSPSSKTISPGRYIFSKNRVASRARRRRGRPVKSGDPARKGARRICSGSAAQPSQRGRGCSNIARTIAERATGGARPLAGPRSRPWIVDRDVDHRRGVLPVRLSLSALETPERLGRQRHGAGRQGRREVDLAPDHVEALTLAERARDRPSEVGLDDHPRVPAPRRPPRVDVALERGQRRRAGTRPLFGPDREEGVPHELDQPPAESRDAALRVPVVPVEQL